MLFKVQKSVGGFDRLFGRNVGHNNQFLLHHIFLSKVLPIIDDCTCLHMKYISNLFTKDMQFGKLNENAQFNKERRE